MTRQANLLCCIQIFLHWMNLRIITVTEINFMMLRNEDSCDLKDVKI